MSIELRLSMELRLDVWPRSIELRLDAWPRSIELRLVGLLLSLDWPDRDDGLPRSTELRL